MSYPIKFVSFAIVCIAALVLMFAGNISGEAHEPMSPQNNGTSIILKGTLKMIVVQGTFAEENTDQTFQPKPSRNVFILESFMGELIVLLRGDRSAGRGVGETGIGQKLQQLANKEVTLTGVLGEGGVFFVDGKSVDQAIADLPVVTVSHFSQPYITLPPDLTHGTKKVLVIRANFLNDTTQPLTESQVRETVFTGAHSSKSFFEEASFGRFRLSSHFNPVEGDVTPYVTINFNNTNCEGLMWGPWTQDARVKAQDLGYFQSFYKHIVVVFNTIPNCTLGPAAQAGRLGDMSNVNYSYLQANQLTAYNVTRGLGYNLGGLGANGWRFYDGPLQDSVDRGDFMGSAYVYPSNWQRLRFGWLSGNYYAVTQSTWYRLVSPAVPIRGSKTAVLVYIPLRNSQSQLTGECMWLESRKNQGFDNFLPSRMSYVNGVTIRYSSCDLVSDTVGPKIFDTTLATQTFDDAPLMNGVYTDPVNDVSISTYQIHNNFQGPVVNITLGPRY